MKFWQSYFNSTHIRKRTNLRD